LRQIFCFGRVPGHAQTQRIHSPAMETVEVLKHELIAARRMASASLSLQRAIEELDGATLLEMHVLGPASECELRRFSTARPVRS
jgi:hypothetical protein